MKSTLSSAATCQGAWTLEGYTKNGAVEQAIFLCALASAQEDYLAVQYGQLIWTP